MSAGLKRLVKTSLRGAGIDVRRYDPASLGRDPFHDAARLLAKQPTAGPVVLFDVGANQGQSIGHFRETFRDPIIHAFEPGSQAYSVLAEKCGRLPGVTLNNFALGSRCEAVAFHENTATDMSSFLPIGKAGWGEVARITTVNVETADGYCDRNRIDRIDVLKSDTQGFDLEVVKGAERMLRAGAVRLIFMELTFAEIYDGIPPFDVVYRHLAERNYRLVSFYDFHYMDDRAAWTDAMFAYTPGPVAPK